MKTLYLLRHAEAAPAAKGGDYERALTPFGVEQAQAVGHYILNHQTIPDFILSSSALRAAQTTQNLMSCMTGENVPSDLNRALYLASEDILLEMITAADNRDNTLLVVAHNPGIAELASILSNGTLSDFTTSYAPATLTVFESEIHSWDEMTAGCMTLKAAHCP